VLAAQGVLHCPLSIPDGQVDSHRAMLFDAIDRRLSPTTLLVAPYERDGHPDHDATGEVCCEIARLREVVLWRYPIWVWHHGNPGQFNGITSSPLVDINKIQTSSMDPYAGFSHSRLF